MDRQLYVILIAVARTLADEPDLPLCPTNIQYFPQNLPMHCKMPSNSNVQALSEQLATLAPYQPVYQSPPADKVPPPVPIPISPPFSPPFAPPFPPALPGPMPIPLAMPIPAPAPAHKLPVIVMPFYSPDPNYKKSIKTPKKIIEINKKRKRKPYFYSDTDTSDTDYDDSDDTDTSSDTTSSEGWWKGKRNAKRNGRRDGRVRRRHRTSRRNHKKKDMLTPILQYVTKDGYVIFEKQISKGEATDWIGRDNDETKNNDENKLGENTNSQGRNNDQINYIKIAEKMKHMKTETTNDDTKNIENDVEVVTRTNTKRHRRRKVNANKPEQ